MPDNFRHAQYDARGIQIDDPQKIYPYLGSWSQEAAFSDFTTQTGIMDTPKTILFGPATVSPQGIISMDAAGIATVLRQGPLFGYTRFRVSRTGASGVSNIFLWVEVSLDGGTQWYPIGESASCSLNSSSDVTTILDLGYVTLPTGSKLRARFARSSTGSDSGDLIPLAVSTALANVGVPSTPSATSQYFTQNDFPYY